MVSLLKSLRDDSRFVLCGECLAAGLEVMRSVSLNACLCGCVNVVPVVDEADPVIPIPLRRCQPVADDQLVLGVEAA